MWKHPLGRYVRTHQFYTCTYQKGSNRKLHTPYPHYLTPYNCTLPYYNRAHTHTHTHFSLLEVRRAHTHTRYPFIPTHTCTHMRNWENAGNNYMSVLSSLPLPHYQHQGHRNQGGEVKPPCSKN